MDGVSDFASIITPLGEIIAFGGATRCQGLPSNALWLYDIKTDEWVALTPTVRGDSLPAMVEATAVLLDYSIG